MSHTILVVDADEPTTAFLAEQLAPDGYEPLTANTADALYEIADQLHVDAVVLGDLDVRRVTIGVLDDIRAADRPLDPDTPVVMLTRHRASLDVLRAFDHGADDVIPKPFEYPELRARIAARLRRHTQSWDVLRVRELVIDTGRRLVLLAGEAITLTELEFDLLVHLAREPDRVFTKAELINQVWGYPAGCSTRTVDSHVCRLRRKLAVNGNRGWVRNVWGVGYALTDARADDHRVARRARQAKAAEGAGWPWPPAASRLVPGGSADD
jgi:DNA-binding response OmpR family regulator